MQLRQWLKDKVTTIYQLSPQLEKNSDIEILHQYRVNLRELQSFAKIYSIKIDKKKLKKLSKIIKKIIKPTSKLRDLDVFLSDINSIECSSKNKLQIIINEQRENLFKEFLYIKKSREYKDNLEQLHLFIKDCKLPINKNISSKVIKKLDNKISKKYHKISIKTPLKKLHAIRMEFRTLRYALRLHQECFKSEIKLSCELADLKILQDLFGAIQDSNSRLKFIVSMKNKFNKEEYVELKNYFEEKIYTAKKNILKF